MVAITPRLQARMVRTSKLARNAGATYSHDVMINGESPKMKQLDGMGLTPFGGGLSAFGGGLYPMGSGILTMGTGLYPFGMGILDKLKGFAKKASSVVRGAIPSSLKKAALDYGKKQIRELTPKVIGKVKEEIAKQSPGVVTRLTDKVVSKLPSGVQGPVSGLATKAAHKGLSLVDSGLNMAQDKVMGAVGGGYYGGGYMAAGMADVLPVSSSDPIMYSPQQMQWMAAQGQRLGMERSVGDVPKRLVMDQHALSLAESILAGQRYAEVKRREAAQQYGMGMEGAMVPYAPRTVGPAKRLTMKPKKKPGRPKGSSTRGKGIVQL